MGRCYWELFRAAPICARCWGRLGYEAGEGKVISVDLRPSDAMYVAKRCKALIYVPKEISVADAVRIGRLCTPKPAYDVYLDCAKDGPDLLTKEFNLLRNMDIAVKEERFKDPN